MRRENLVDVSGAEQEIEGVLYIFRLSELIFFLALLAIPMFSLIVVIAGWADTEPNYGVLLVMAPTLVLAYALLYSLKSAAKPAFIVLAALNGLIFILMLTAFIWLAINDEIAFGDLWNLALAFAFELPVLVFALRALKIPREQIGLLAQQKSQPLSFASLLETVGVPKNFSLTGRRAPLIVVLSALSTLSLGIWFNSLQRVGLVFEELSEFGDIIQLFALAFTLVIMMGAHRISDYFGRKSFQICRASLQQALQRDRRPPVLFLRSFTNDQVRLEPLKRGMFSKTLGVQRHLETLDGLIVDEATRYGPVVALGAPREQHPPFGAARAYVEGDWQAAIQELAESASAIILCFNKTEGVLWELSLIERKDLFCKTLIVFPFHFLAEYIPLLRQHRLNVIADAMEAATADTDTTVPVALFSPDGNAVHTLHSIERPAVAYMLALRMFLRSHYGVGPSPSTAEDPSALLEVPDSGVVPPQDRGARP